MIGLRTLSFHCLHSITLSKLEYVNSIIIFIGTFVCAFCVYMFSQLCVCVLHLIILLIFVCICVCVFQTIEAYYTWWQSLIRACGHWTVSLSWYLWLRFLHGLINSIIAKKPYLTKKPIASSYVDANLHPNCKVCLLKLSKQRLLVETLLVSQDSSKSFSWVFLGKPCLYWAYFMVSWGSCDNNLLRETCFHALYHQLMS